MKKIGFIDFFLDEWHANNYPDWLRANIAEKKRDIEVAYAWAETDKPGGTDTAGWCEKFSVQALSSLEELIDKSDYMIIFSPDHPEHHERLSRLALMSGKPVYMDKTFSPDVQSAVRMFDLAAQYDTPLFSSSALRFAKELAAYPDETINRNSLEYVATSGPGTYENYSVHQFENIVSLMGTGAHKIKSLSSSHGRLFVVDYADGRQASMLQSSFTPFQIGLQLNNGEGVFINECTDIFPRLIDAVLDFFVSGKTPVPMEETVEIMALIEAGFKALANRDTWVTVEHARS